MESQVDKWRGEMFTSVKQHEQIKLEIKFTKNKPGYKLRPMLLYLHINNNLIFILTHSIFWWVAYEQVFTAHRQISWLPASRAWAYALIMLVHYQKDQTPNS